jgi:hypothetical protein
MEAQRVRMHDRTTATIVRTIEERAAFGQPTKVSERVGT